LEKNSSNTEINAPPVLLENPPIETNSLEINSFELNKTETELPPEKIENIEKNENNEKKENNEKFIITTENYLSPPPFEKKVTSSFILEKEESSVQIERNSSFRQIPTLSGLPDVLSSQSFLNLYNTDHNNNQEVTINNENYGTLPDKKEYLENENGFFFHPSSHFPIVPKHNFTEVETKELKRKKKKKKIKKKEGERKKIKKEKRKERKRRKRVRHFKA